MSDDVSAEAIDVLGCAVRTWKIDSVHSQMRFVIKHVRVGEAHGLAGDLSGAMAPVASV